MTVEELKIGLKDYKGLMIDFYFPHHVVYQKGGTKVLFQGMNVSECKEWVDELIEWMNKVD